MAAGVGRLVVAAGFGRGLCVGLGVADGDCVGSGAVALGLAVLAVVACVDEAAEHPLIATATVVAAATTIAGTAIPRRRAGNVRPSVATRETYQFRLRRLLPLQRLKGQGLFASVPDL